MTIGRSFANSAPLFICSTLAQGSSMISWIAYVGGSFIAMVLVVAGIAKLGKKQQFSRTVQSYRVVSPRTARMIAAVLPEAEVLLGCLLLVKVAVVFAGTVACGLFVIFATAVGTNLARGRRIACGCFGPSERRPLRWSHVVQNIVLAIVSLLSVYMWRVQSSPPLWHSQWAATLAAAVILVTWWLVSLSSRLLRSAQ